MVRTIFLIIAVANIVMDYIVFLLTGSTPPSWRALFCTDIFALSLAILFALSRNRS